MIISSASLFQTSQIRECERKAVIDFGITESEMMDRAGSAAFELLVRRFPDVKKLAVFCGSGNNAGDGYVLAHRAHELGFLVQIHQYKSPKALPPAARAAAEAALAAGVCCRPMAEPLENDVDLIVDALLGIGLSGMVTEPLACAVNQINTSKLPILALDIPSGLNADTGQKMGVCVQATATITFMGYKTGMMTLDGPDHCGNIFCDDLGLADCLATLSPVVRLLGSSGSELLPEKRQKNCHKNDFGHVLLVGGGLGMPGALHLAANAALRVGAGCVSLGTRPEYAQAMLNGLPEAMIHGLHQASDLEPLLEKATIGVIGPGLGMDDWARQLFRQMLASGLPLIIDASALRLFAGLSRQHASHVLTPHPGEAACLLDCTTDEIQNDRYRAVSLLQEQYGGNIVLKGVGSLVRTEEQSTFLCEAGNPGMATAGMGDVLSGVIAGLAAQGMTLSAAARLGVWLHASAADRAVRESGQRGLLASDLMGWLRFLVNGCNVEH